MLLKRTAHDIVPFIGERRNDPQPNPTKPAASDCGVRGLDFGAFWSGWRQHRKLWGLQHQHQTAILEAHSTRTTATSPKHIPKASYAKRDRDDPHDTYPRTNLKTTRSWISDMAAES
jgi:hypothetical protein